MGKGDFIDVTEVPLYFLFSLVSAGERQLVWFSRALLIILDPQCSSLGSIASGNIEVLGETKLTVSLGASH